MPAPTERASTEPAPTESVFARMTRLSAQRGAVNLGQGFPSDPAPDFLLSALRQAPGHTDQYTGPAGLPALRESLEADLGVPAEDLLVTCGATEALLVALLALVEPGDEVLFFEPAFDIYGPQVRLAGGVPVPVPLTFGPGGWAPDWEGLRAAVTGRTRILLLNNPLNPTGSVFNEADLAGVAALAREHEVHVRDDMGPGAILEELYAELVEARTIQPTFYTDFPAETSPLTGPHRSKPGLVERWDLVICGMEIGTAYSELADPIEQRRRLTEQSWKAAHGDAEAMEVDEDFLAALEAGMPPAGGLGIGMDRLVMLMTNTTIREVLTFPFVRPRR